MLKQAEDANFHTAWSWRTSAECRGAAVGAISIESDTGGTTSAQIVCAPASTSVDGTRTGPRRAAQKAPRAMQTCWSCGRRTGVVGGGQRRVQSACFGNHERIEGDAAGRSRYERIDVELIDRAGKVGAKH